MTELLSAEQMRAIEAGAIGSGNVSGLALMEAAGRGVAQAIFLEWPELSMGTHRALVLCGPGNNGGDGYVVARRLADRGWSVDLFAFGDPAKLPTDAARNHAVWCAMGAVHPFVAEKILAAPRPAILIDALFGTGLTRELPQPVEDLFRRLHDIPEDRSGSPPVRRVAVDCPSGLDTDTGLVRQNADRGHDAGRMVHRADLSLTFAAPKLGHFLSGAPDVCGNLRTVPLPGLTDLARERRRPDECPDTERVRLVGAPFEGQVMPWLRNVARREGRHKFDHGHALVLSGGQGQGGAARLAARGALRIGAGLVTVGCPPEALTENAARLDAIMLRPVADAEALGQMLGDRRINALCLGPGMGAGERTRAMVATALDAGRRVVLDADALTAFEEDPQALFTLLTDQTVLTPHTGEFARIFPDLADRLAAEAGERNGYSRVSAAREAAARSGAVVLFKGADTVIAHPSGAASVHVAAYGREVPWLATAGAGDVLAGFLIGLLARLPAAPHYCAEAATWLHVECARAVGPGLIAEDLAEALPKVLAGLAERGLA